MKRIAVVLAVCLLPVISSFAADKAVAKAKPSGILLTVAGRVDPSIADAVKKQLAKRIGVPVRVKQVALPAGATVAKALPLVQRSMRPEDMCAVCLGGQEFSWPRFSVMSNESVAMIGVPALKPVDAEKLDYVWMRRVRKESARAVGLMLGLKDCPFPRCALLNTVNDTQLDRKGDSPCPPCAVKLEALLKQRGVTPVYK